MKGGRRVSSDSLLLFYHSIWQKKETGFDLE
jgi:hypothetical protein